MSKEKQMSKQCLGMDNEDAARLLHDIFNMIPDRPDIRLVVSILYIVLKAARYDRKESRDALMLLALNIDRLPDPPQKDSERNRREPQQ